MIPFIDLESGFLTTEELLFLAGASGGGGVEHTIINNPATFTTDMAKPLRKLLIPFTPVQSGSGDPSPTNIRPITGWTGLNIYQSGENTSNPETTAVSWSTEAGTVYGGTLDALTGVLTVTHIQKAFKKSDYGPETAGTAIPYRQTGGNTKDIAPISGINWTQAKKTQIMNCARIANPYSETQYGNYVGVVFWQTSTGTVFRISAPLYDALSESDEIIYCYELATPQTVQLDPVTLSTLVGDNVIWTDTNGDNTIVYLKKT